MHQNHFWNLLAKHLSGNASEEEAAELEALIKAHPELSFAAQHVTDLWKLKGGYNVTEAEQAFKKHIQVLAEQDAALTDLALMKEETKQKTNKLQPLFYILLALALFAGSLFIWKKDAKTTDTQFTQLAEVLTRPGSRTRLVLPDNSVVWLNAGSKLTYPQPFGGSDRTVTLTGEAFFDVVKSSKPFIIHTEGIQIRVLGTAFNVRSYPAEKKIETSLIHGRVEITLDKSPEKKYVLKPNEKLTLNTEENKSTLHAAKNPLPLAIVSNLRYLDSNTIAETSWVENKLIFLDESFEDVARKMERWYGVTILIKDKELMQMRVGGGPFVNETIDQALLALQIAFNFHFTNKGNQIIITR